MLIWINGTFGVGKTQTAHELHRRLPNSVVIDPEVLGFGIQRMYPEALRQDFQESPWWAPVLTEILLDLTQRQRGTIIVPMTLVDVPRYGQIHGDLRDGGCDLRQVTLLADRQSVVRRLRSRFERTSGWAGERFDSVTAALENERFAPHLDTSRMTIPEVADAIAGIVGLELTPADRNPFRSAVRRWSIQVRHVRLG